MKNSMTRRRAALMLGSAALASQVPMAPAWAQAPSGKPLRIIYGFAPGGGDVLSRAITDELGVRLGRPVVFENKPGAAGSIGLEMVAQSPPDGDTLGVLAITTLLNYAALGKPFDVDKLTPISLMWENYNVLVINPEFPGLADVRNLQGLLEAARKRPDGLNYTSAGIGGTGHLIMEWIVGRAGVNMVHVPYKGSGPATVDVLGGQLGVMMTDASNASQYIKSGKLRPLAVSFAQRAPDLPQVPTIAEQGFPDIVAVPWVMLVGPARLPAESAQRIAREMRQVYTSQRLADRLAMVNAIPRPTTPEESKAILVRDFANWRKVVADYKIKVE